MSKTAAAEFFRRAFEEDAFKDQILNALSQPDRAASLERVAVQAGYSFTDAEFRAMREDLIELLRSNSELSEASLDAVSGGGKDPTGALASALNQAAGDTQDQKAYFLSQLASQNATAEALADYFAELTASASSSSSSSSGSSTSWSSGKTKK
jgi:hypothetical protein